MRKSFNNFILVFGILCLIYYLGMGIAIRFGQSLLWIWALLGIICIVRYLLVRRSINNGKPVPLPRWFVVVWRVLWVIGLSVVIVGEVLIGSKAVSKAPGGLDHIIVLGARVNGTVPSGALRERIEAAAEYLLANPDTICVASGGQGSGEDMTEADCIIRELKARGISEDRLIAEDKATDTRENLRNSLELIGDSGRNIGIVTNDFHVYRAVGMALTASSDYSFCGISAPSTIFGYIHYAVRELASIALAIMEGSLSPSVLLR